MTKPITEGDYFATYGAYERAHYEPGAEFNSFFALLLRSTESCRQRDVLRDTKEDLWQYYKANYKKWKEEDD